MKLLLLPGLHGTAELFDSFRECAPDNYRLDAVSYPPHEPLPWADLAALVTRELSGTDRVVIVAESFSGPVAVLVAIANPERLAGLVLCNSFIVPPVSPAWRYFPWKTLFRIPGPEIIIRGVFVGSEVDETYVKRIRGLVLASDPEVLTGRMQLVLSVDLRDELSRLELPVLDLRGHHDRLVSRRAGAVVAAANPKVIQRTIDGPHFLLQVSPSRAWQEIDNFIQEHCATSQLAYQAELRQQGR